MSNSTIHDIARVLPIIEFLLAAQHSSQELRLRGRLGDAPHDRNAESVLLAPRG